MSRRRGSAARWVFVGALAVGSALSGACRQDMHDAPRYDPLEASPVLASGTSAQPLIEGTVARGQLGGDTMRETGRVNDQPATEFPFPITRADLDRGQERFNIFCAPCHGRQGDGNGMVVQRGYRQPTSYHDDRLRQAAPGYFFDVMTNGFATMPAYRAQVSPDDRWRIAAYIRALQLSHQGTTADVPADELKRLQGGETAPAAAAPQSGGGN
jgi:mono/diheme cytochrome c family protein